MDIRVQAEHDATEQDRRHVNQQEQRQIGAGPGLQPGEPSPASRPAGPQQTQAAARLHHDRQQQERFDDRLAVHAARAVHEAQVGRDAAQRRQVIGQVHEHEQRHDDGAEPVNLAHGPHEVRRSSASHSDSRGRKVMLKTGSGGAMPADGAT
jgi:hypothetical protein